MQADPRQEMWKIAAILDVSEEIDRFPCVLVNVLGRIALQVLGQLINELVELLDVFIVPVM